MDSVSKAPGLARLRGFAFFAFLLASLAACGPLPETPDPDGGSPPSEENPSPAPEDPSPDPVPDPEPPTVGSPLVPALWENSHPQDGPLWSQHAYNVINEYGASLVGGSSDVASFCPRYKSLNREQKITFWVYLVSAIAKYESGYDPANRYKESTMGTDPVTGQPVYSEGLLQLSYQDSRNYSFCDEFDWSVDRHLDPDDPRKTILDPYKNLSCGIRILNQLVGKKNLIAFGSGHYWSVLKTTSSHNRVSSIQSLTKQVSFCK
jgi:hypothetical protein